MRPGFIPEAISFWTENKEELNELKRRVERLLAKEILSGEVDPLAAPFRPDRFVRNIQPLVEDR